MQPGRPGTGLCARALGGLLWALACHAALALPLADPDATATPDAPVSQIAPTDAVVPAQMPSNPPAPDSTLPEPAAARADAIDLPQMRRLYINALESLDEGRFDAFESAKAQLTDYPLYPYLDFQDHRRRLHELTPAEVAAFRERWKDSPIAGRLYDEWMDDLAHRGAWDLFLQNYEPTPNNAERQCDYLRALDRSGKHDAAMAAVEPLWLVGTSQPKTCDALFATWIQRGLVNNRMVWDRLTLALQARSWDLARYLAGLLSPELRKQGELFYRVGRDPALISDTAHFAANDDATRQIVKYGLRRLASNDPDAAAAAWSTYSTTLTFDADDTRVIRQDLTIGFARHGVLDPNADLAPSPDGRHLLVYEALILAALTNKDWASVISLINRLDGGERAKQRWQYWLGRAQRALAGTPGLDLPKTSPWEPLAGDRQYYGFLAAQSLGKPLALNDQPGRPEPDVLATMQQHPAMKRMTELYTIGDRANARREWVMLLPKLDGEERAGAAYVIADLGWIDLSIMAANAADLRDDLSLRFPTPFTPTFVKESRATSVPISFLYGIARQESAFAPAARSSAGALGLMQLMPATAAATARDAGEPSPVAAALFDPALNVHIASRHIAELLERYDGNRVLAAAAYNAGPHRVDRWLRDRPARPADVWIETIPFAETRDYVKNVMAFAYIYGQRLGHPTKFLDADER
jgi:soluble lytic murein transglycosylase